MLDNSQDRAGKRKRGRPPREAAGLLEAAAIVFARDGFSAATIELIAAEADASPTTIYKLFGNKADLFVEVMNAQIWRSIRRLEETAVSAEHPLVNLYRVLRTHAEDCTTERGRGLLRAYISEMRANAALTAAVVERVESTTIITLMKLVNDAIVIGDLEPMSRTFAAHGVASFAERYSLQLGLLVGDAYPAMFSADRMALEAVVWLLLRFGTEKGRSKLDGIEVFLGSDIADFRELESAVHT